VRVLILFSCAWALLAQDAAVRPERTIHLFDGKSLDAFDTWLVDHHHSDPNRVFTVIDQIDGAPAIRVSGQGYGGIITKQRFRDYKLITEYRWGGITWGARKDKTRDSGILIHSQGRPGSSRADFNGPWMHSIEFQIIEGGVGDILFVGGYDEGGELRKPSAKVKTKTDRDGEPVFDPNGTEQVHSARRVNWWGRDVDWADKLGFRGPVDVDSPGQEWTRLEAVVEGGNLIYYVNGKLVNQARDASLTEGKLLFQTEGAEIYFRKITLEPLR